MKSLRSLLQLKEEMHYHGASASLEAGLVGSTSFISIGHLDSHLMQDIFPLIPLSHLSPYVVCLHCLY